MSTCLAYPQHSAHEEKRGADVHKGLVRTAGCARRRRPGPLSRRGANGQGWRNAREFACCVGLVPRHSGSGGKVVMGGLSKRGDPYLRTVLTCGARAVLCSPKAPPWALQMLQRRPFNVVVVALAHKMARTAWAIVANGRHFDSAWKSTPPTLTATMMKQQ